jgi:hypothetical protein
MKFSATAKAPGSQAGTGIDDDRIAWENRPQPGWLCDKNPEHFDPKVRALNSKSANDGAPTRKLPRALNDADRRPSKCEARRNSGRVAEYESKGWLGAVRLCGSCSGNGRDAFHEGTAGIGRAPVRSWC